MPTALAFDFGALRQAVEGPDGSSPYQGVRICQALFDLWQESRIAGVAGGNQYIAQKARHSYPLDRAGGEKCAKALIDRKSTRLNSSHVAISYAVFCLKKKK